MKKRIVSILVIVLAAAVLAAAGELMLDRFAEGTAVEEVREKGSYQLFPGDETYVDCEYSGGELIIYGNDPQMIFAVSPEQALGEMTVKYSAPLQDACEIQIYYDDAGTGFSAEKALVAMAFAGTTETVIPLPRNVYYNLRVDINGQVPLEGIECDASSYETKLIPGGFRAARFILALIALAALLYFAYVYRQNESTRGSVKAYAEFVRSDAVWALLVSVAVSAYFNAYYHMKDCYNIRDAARFMLQPLWPVMVVAFLIIYGCMYVCRKTNFHPGDWLYRKRWYIGGGLMVLALLLNLNTSSLHEWAGYLGTQDKSGLVLGVQRGVRSDEWAKVIGILKALNYENYPVFSNLLRATPTENDLIAGHVAWSVSALYRPLSWGHLLFGSVNAGLTVSTIGPIILMFLLSFDFFMLLSKSRKLSFAFACVLVFSPFVQWWTSYDVFIASFALLLAGHRYLTTERVKTKLLSALAVVIFAGNFALVMYPAWQIPVAYFLLGGLIWIIIRYRKEIKLKAKVDIPIIGGALLILLGSAVIIYLQSAGAVQEMMNTVYPGAVRTNSPMNPKQLYLTYLNMFSPYTSQYVPGPNLSEAADFITFFPVGIILCVFAMIRNRKADSFSIIMIILSAFLGAFSFLDVPEILRKVTLMFFTMGTRVLPWFGFVQILLFFRGVSLLKKDVKWYIALPFTVAYALFVIRKIMDYGKVAGDYMILAIVGVVISVIITAALRSGKNEGTQRAFATIMAVFALMTSGTVNPIQQGMPEIDESQIVKHIRAVVEEDSEGKWLVDNLNYPYGTVPLFGGAPTINCVNNYPNLEMWHKLDPEEDEDFAYNRYVSQIVTDITKDQTTFSVGPVDDLSILHLNVDDMEMIEVKYVLTNRALEELGTEYVKFVLMDATGMFRIYRVEYQ